MDFPHRVPFGPDTHNVWTLADGQSAEAGSQAVAMEERASEGEDADLDDVEDFQSEDSVADDEATLEEEEACTLCTSSSSHDC